MHPQPQPQQPWPPANPRRRSGVRSLVPWIVIAVLAGSLAVGGLALALASDSSEPEAQPASPLPGDICGFIGKEFLRTIIAEAEFTSTPGFDQDSQRSGQCDVEAPRGADSFQVDIEHYGPTLTETSEEHAKGFFDAYCNNFDGSWAGEDQDTPVPNVGERVCGEPGSATKLYVLDGRNIVGVTFLAMPMEDTATLPEKAAAIARRTLEKMETLD